MASHRYHLVQTKALAAPFLIAITADTRDRRARGDIFVVSPDASALVAVFSLNLAAAPIFGSDVDEDFVHAVSLNAALEELAQHLGSAADDLPADAVSLSSPAQISQWLVLGKFQAIEELRKHTSNLGLSEDVKEFRYIEQAVKRSKL